MNYRIIEFKMIFYYDLLGNCTFNKCDIVGGYGPLSN